MISVIRITTSAFLLSGLVITWLSGANIVTLISVITILTTTLLMVETCIQSFRLPYSWSEERRPRSTNEPCHGGEDSEAMKDAA